MTGVPASSRWADDEDDIAAEVQRKREKAERKRARAAKQQEQQQQQQQQQQKQQAQEQEQQQLKSNQSPEEENQTLQQREANSANVENQLSSPSGSGPPAKRRRLSPQIIQDAPVKLLRFDASTWGPSRHVDNFERLNHIEEGSYGWVSRAKESATGEIVALKKLKMEIAHEGFPITALREIKTLTESRHRHIVKLREVVVGDTLNDTFLVMEFLEHDLKTLQEDMAEPFLPSEVKTLLLQLVSAVDYLHDHWILHRDLKTSNILMNNRGEIKVADFGMARHFADPLPPNMTQLVVTLWYRAPELLLGTDKYNQAIDMWSIGCIFGELLTKEPLLQGKNEVDELTKIFELCGIPTEATWPGFRRLPNAKALRLPRVSASTANGPVIRARFPFLTSSGVTLLTRLLSLDPEKRPLTSEVLNHAYFSEDPKPKSTAMFPTFPSKAGQERRRKVVSPSAPKRGDAPQLDGRGLDFSNIFAGRENEESGAGFQLKLV